MVKVGTKKGCFAGHFLWQRGIVTHKMNGPAVFDEIVSGRAAAEIASRCLKLKSAASVRSGIGLATSQIPRFMHTMQYVSAEQVNG